MGYLIAVDVGTSSTKTALRDLQGRLLAEASAAYAIQRPFPTWAEIDVECWWQAVCATVRQVVSLARVDPSEVRGLGVDGVSWTLIPVDSSVRPLCPAMIWLDRRAEAEAAELRAQPEAEGWVNLAANPLDAAYVTPKLLWLRKHRPQIFNAAHAFLNSTGYIVAKLTGALTCDITQAYAYHFYDMRRQSWDADAAQQLGVPLEKMPALVSPLDVVGQMTPSAAQALGLVAGIPVIAGGLDAAVGALGAGVVRAGQTVDQGGQAGGMLMSVEQVIVEPLLIFGHHVLPGQYLLQSGTVGGGALGWFREIVRQHGQPEDFSFAAMSAEASQVPAGAHGLLFLPYLAGERTPLWNSQARGVFFGLSYQTTRADMLRAMMEGCAFAVYHGLRLAEGRGATVQEWLGDGGAASSPVWCQIKADVTGNPFVVASQVDGSLGGHTLGLFAMTAQAVGVCTTAQVPALVEHLLPNRRVYTPDAARHAMYAQLFDVYAHLSALLTDPFTHLARVVQAYSLEGTER